MDLTEFRNIEFEETLRSINTARINAHLNRVSTLYNVNSYVFRLKPISLSPINSRPSKRRPTIRRGQFTRSNMIGNSSKMKEKKKESDGGSESDSGCDDHSSEEKQEMLDDSDMETPGNDSEYGMVTTRGGLRRSARLASKPRASYTNMDTSTSHVQSQAYGASYDRIDDSFEDTKFASYFQSLQSKYPMKLIKDVFDIDKFRAAQQLDIKLKTIYDYLESGKRDQIDHVFDPIKHKNWLLKLKNNCFLIYDELLYYNDKSKKSVFNHGCLVVPDVFILSLIRYFHVSMYQHHSGVELLYSYLKFRFYWQNMKRDIKFVIASCKNCNSSKGKCDSLELNPWFTQQPGELLVYDFLGPVYQSLYIACFMDDFTGKCQLTVVFKCDAIVVCKLLLEKWVLEHGFPIQMIGDLGSSNFNEVVLAIQDISGIIGLYATPQCHQSIGKIENLIKQIQQKYRIANHDLDGKLTDQLQREEAIVEVQQLLPGIQFALNASVSTRTGYSPNMLDKGRHLRGIPDVKLALRKLKKCVDSGMPKQQQVQYLRDLQKQLMYYRKCKNYKQFKYILYNCNKHNMNIGSNHNYKSGDLVGLYIANPNKLTAKWEPRYHKSLVIESLNNGQIRVKDLVVDKIKTISKRLIKPYKENDPLWLDEYDYQQLQKDIKLEDQSRVVTFSEGNIKQKKEDFVNSLKIKDWQF